jgi:nucleotidyltransferase/DNA polymerase involved in DNA repair
MPGFDFSEAAIDAYKAISLHIRQIFAEYTPIIEPLSLDDVYERHSGNRSVEPEHIEQPTAQIVGHGYPQRGPGSARKPIADLPTTSWTVIAFAGWNSH